MKRFSAAVFVSGGKILLGKRSSKRLFYPGVWDFIGGHCLGQETFTAALVRECSEEIDVVPLEFKLLKHIDESPRFILEVFVVTRWQGSIRNVNQSEHETVSWFTVEEALKLTLADERYKDLFRLLEETCPF
jgi:8-oxo-dGTP diphosphatase